MTPPSIPRLRRGIASVVNIVGARSLTWLGLAVLAGLALSVIEAALAAFLQVLLKSFGLLGTQVVGLKFLTRLDPSPGLLIGLLLAIGLSRSLCQMVVQHAASFSLEAIGARLRLAAVHDMLLRRDGRFVSAGSVHHLFEEVFPKTAYAVYFGAQALPMIAQCAAIVGFMIALAPGASLIALPGLLLVGLLVLSVNARSRKLAARVPVAQKALAEGVERVARNWLLVRVGRLERREFRDLASSIVTHTRHNVRMALFTVVASTLPSLLGIVLLTGVIAFARGITDGMVLVSFFYLFVRLTQSLGLISFYGGLIHSSLPQLRAASAFIQQMDPEGLATTSRIAEGLTTLGTFRGRLPELPAEADQGALSISGPPSLRVRDLSFRYPGVAGLVFEGLDLDVAPGAQLGVVGRSGSGKSTLLALLLGVLRPERGEVLIGGQPAMVFLEQYAQRVGFVGAEPFLVMGSLRDNLSYGSSRKFTPEEYRAALESASLLPWVESLPEGLDYFIQEDGSGLSAGQKQRLALARALLRQPVLLVADEVSANLDQQTEAEVARMIAGLKGRTTVLLVSHRRELLVHADAILTVSDEGHELAAGPGREPTERSTGLGAG